jgi:hypothetical protein
MTGGNGSWPPFEPGNDAALTHGTYSQAAVAVRAEQVRDELLTFAPYLNEDRFYPAIHRYLTACAREQLAHDALMTRGMEAKGSTRLLEVATAAARLAAKLGSDLGLDPIGHAKIRALSAGADASGAAADLASLSAAGKAARLAAGENGGER